MPGTNERPPVTLPENISIVRHTDDRLYIVWLTGRRCDVFFFLIQFEKTSVNIGECTMPMVQGTRATPNCTSEDIFTGDGV